MSSIADSSHDKITYNDSTVTGKATSKINKRIVLSLLLAIGFVWLVLLIPIIVFHLPDEIFISQVSLATKV